MKADFDLAFTPTFTTASGELRFTLPISASSVSRASGSVSTKKNVLFPTGCTYASPYAIGTFVRLTAGGSNVPDTPIIMSNLVSGQAVNIRFSIEYPF